MSPDDKFPAIRKGLLEFLLLKIIAADKVYVADILGRLEDGPFATQEGTLYPLLSRMRRFDGAIASRLARSWRSCPFLGLLSFWLTITASGVSITR